MLFLPLSSTIALSMVKRPSLKIKKANEGLLTRIKPPLEICFVNFLDSSYVYMETSSNLTHKYLPHNFLMKTILEIITQKHYLACAPPGLSNTEERFLYNDSVRWSLIKIIFNNIPKQITGTVYRRNNSKHVNIAGNLVYEDLVLEYIIETTFNNYSKQIIEKAFEMYNGSIMEGFIQIIFNNISKQITEKGFDEN